MPKQIGPKEQKLKELREARSSKTVLRVKASGIGKVVNVKASKRGGRGR
jgi:hypothetical protein